MYKSFASNQSFLVMSSTLRRLQEKGKTLFASICPQNVDCIVNLLKEFIDATKTTTELPPDMKSLLHEPFICLIQHGECHPQVLESILLQIFPYIHSQLPPTTRLHLLQTILDALRHVQQTIASVWPAIRMKLALTYEGTTELDVPIKLLVDAVSDNMVAMSDEDLCICCIQAAELSLEANDAQRAEQMLHRCGTAITTEVPSGLKLRYRIANAKLCDHRRKFLDACRRFLALSMEPQLVDEQRAHFLTHAMLMAILAPAGQFRSRLLASLFVDERSRMCPLYNLLEKMYMGRILKEDDMRVLSPLLSPHHLSTMPDGMSLVDSVILEHNMFSAHLLYNNITLPNLSNLLKVTPEKAESVACAMISEGRMGGKIDQIDGIIYFERSEAMSRWDAHIQDVCNMVNSAYEQLLALHPAWVIAQQRVPAAISTNVSSSPSSVGGPPPTTSDAVGTISSLATASTSAS